MLDLSTNVHEKILSMVGVIMHVPNRLPARAILLYFPYPNLKT